MDHLALPPDGRESAHKGSIEPWLTMRQMLSGCDYLDSIPGVGLKTAHRLLRRHKTVEKVVQMIRLEGTLNVPTGYIQSFAQAELAFLHQRVFDPATKRLIPLNDFPEGGLSEEDQKWVGLDLDVEVAQGVARGDLHPETHLAIEDMCPDYQPQSRGTAQKVRCHPDVPSFRLTSRSPSCPPREPKWPDPWTPSYPVSVTPSACRPGHRLT